MARWSITVDAGEEVVVVHAATGEDDTAHCLGDMVEQTVDLIPQLVL